MINNFDENRRLNKEITRDEIDDEIAALELEFDSTLSELNRLYRNERETLVTDVRTEIELFNSRFYIELCQRRHNTIFTKLNAYYMLKDGFELPIVCRDKTYSREPIVEIILEEDDENIKEYEIDLWAERKQELQKREIGRLSLD